MMSAGGVYAQLTGFEMPEISQQIYAANAVTATDSSVIISWATTKESSSQISCIADGGEAIVKTSDVLTISHQMEVGWTFICHKLHLYNDGFSW